MPSGSDGAAAAGGGAAGAGSASRPRASQRSLADFAVSRTAFPAFLARITAAWDAAACVPSPLACWTPTCSAPKRTACSAVCRVASPISRRTSQTTGFSTGTEHSASVTPGPSRKACTSLSLTRPSRSASLAVILPRGTNFSTGPAYKRHTAWTAAARAPCAWGTRARSPASMPAVAYMIRAWTSSSRMSWPKMAAMRQTLLMRLHRGYTSAAGMPMPGMSTIRYRVASVRKDDLSSTTFWAAVSGSPSPRCNTSFRLDSVDWRAEGWPSIASFRRAFAARSKASCPTSVALSTAASTGSAGSSSEPAPLVPRSSSRETPMPVETSATPPAVLGAAAASERRPEAASWLARRFRTPHRAADFSAAAAFSAAMMSLTELGTSPTTGTR
mmetsp:Transcript_44611/g.133179  ORF Transcript_44611/g.133179 Transcript_44611/m.133179 type:complete len:387 (+) Transcript_44611:49-1209(+)